MKKYIKKDAPPVTAVQLNLETEGLAYQKWGGAQTAKAGDWILNNAGECYSVDKDSFAATYSEVSPGQYIKTASVWAEDATADGTIDTKEGATSYRAGDMLVYNNKGRTDGYAMTKNKFDSMYELAPMSQAS